MVGAVAEVSGSTADKEVDWGPRKLMPRVADTRSCMHVPHTAHKFTLIRTVFSLQDVHYAARKNSMHSCILEKHVEDCGPAPAWQLSSWLASSIEQSSISLPVFFLLLNLPLHYHQWRVGKAGFVAATVRACGSHLHLHWHRMSKQMHRSLQLVEGFLMLARRQQVCATLSSMLGRGSRGTGAASTSP